MTTFVVLGRYTHASIKDISAERTAAANEVVKGLGGEIISGYAMLGKHDLLIVVDFPSIENAMKASIELSKLLGISFTTSPAVSMEEFDKLVG